VVPYLPLPEVQKRATGKPTAMEAPASSSQK